MTEQRTVVTLHGTTDAQTWAREWCRIATEIRDRGDEIVDEGWMIGWFANAIETGRDAGLRVPVELPHMPGCTDPTHRPLTSLCTTEPALGVLPWTSA